MKFLSKEQARALAILVGVVLVLELLFGGIRVSVKTAFSNYAWNQQAAAAGACVSASDFALPVAHQLCKPAGKPPKGRDGVKCGVQTLPNGTKIDGICVAGCCKGVAYSSASGAVSTFLSGLGGIGQNFLVQSALGLVTQLISGGGSGGGGGGGSFGDGYTPLVEEDPYLTYDPNVGTGANDEFNLAFGEGTQNGTNLAFDNTNTTGVRNQDTTNPTGNTPGVEQKPSAEGDEVTTAYEYLRSLTQGAPGGTVDTSLSGEEEFEQDYFGTSFSSSADIQYQGGLSIADLEIGGAIQQERTLQAGLGENEQYFGGIDDYRSSAVARSGSKVEVNPLSNSRYDELSYNAEAGKLSWWQSLVLLIGSMLGLVGPTS